jgi:hypothetical protein
MDGIVMPIALLVLAFVLRSVRLLSLTIISLLVSVLVSFGIMYGCIFAFIIYYYYYFRFSSDSPTT